MSHPPSIPSRHISEGLCEYNCLRLTPTSCRPSDWSDGRQDKKSSTPFPIGLTACERLFFTSIVVLSFWLQRLLFLFLGLELFTRGNWIFPIPHIYMIYRVQGWYTIHHSALPFPPKSAALPPENRRSFLLPYVFSLRRNY